MKTKKTIGEKAELLKGALGVGRHNAQTVKVLAQKVGLTPRDIWVTTEYMTRVLGETIGSSKSKPAGLWLEEDNPTEYMHTIKAHRIEANTMLATADIMEQNAIKKWGSS